VFCDRSYLIEYIYIYTYKHSYAYCYSYSYSYNNEHNFELQLHSPVPESISDLTHKLAVSLSTVSYGTRRRPGEPVVQSPRGTVHYYPVLGRLRFRGPYMFSLGGIENPEGLEDRVSNGLD
jgi:hypothetical protein